MFVIEMRTLLFELERFFGVPWECRALLVLCTFGVRMGGDAGRIFPDFAVAALSLGRQNEKRLRRTPEAQRKREKKGENRNKEEMRESLRKKKKKQCFSSFGSTGHNGPHPRALHSLAQRSSRRGDPRQTGDRASPHRRPRRASQSSAGATRYIAPCRDRTR